MSKKLRYIWIPVLILALCLLPVSALAAAEGDTADLAPAANPEEEISVPEPAAEDPAETAEEPVVVGPQDAFFASENSVVYNNAGVVYNNGGTVYNNAGIVYNNGGTVYNNGGTVYGNAGTVYNNGGTVYNNSAVVYNNGAPVSGDETVVPDGSLAETGGDASDADSDTPEAEPEAPETDGEALPPSLAAPVFDTAPGTYGHELSVQISAAEGAQIYYTTDGSEPTAESELYEGPVSIQEGLLLRAVAVAEGESSPVAEAAYALIVITVPEFEPVQPGYHHPDGQAFAVSNPGSVDAVIERVSLSGESRGSFILNYSQGRTIPAGGVNDSTWRLQPLSGLPAGEYSGLVSFALDSGETVEVEVPFSVQEAAD